MSIPLVQNNEKDSINTSIIAIKKNLERINTLLGLVDSSEPDLSGFATKQELEDTVTEINNTIDEVETLLQPVDTVTSGNMHSVTSNAVANSLGTTTGWITVTEGVYYKIRNSICTVQIDLSSGHFNENGTMSIATLPQEARPSRALQMPASVYGVSGTPSYNQTQTWLRVGTSGGLTFISGLVNKDVTECHATATYCLSN